MFINWEQSAIITAGVLREQSAHYKWSVIIHMESRSAFNNYTNIFGCMMVLKYADYGM